MLRICAALAVALLVPGMASAKELKPKFGDIGGVYYTEVSQDREACRQAIKNKVALCRQNTSFVSNTMDRKYPGCLPIFRQQAGACADHFRSEAYKCRGDGAVRIADFTGFACTVTATVVEEGDEPESGPDTAPMDRRMTARTRVNLRAGPGTNHRVVGTLAAGQAVQTTGRVGDWLRIAAPGGGTAFVHGSLLIGSQPASQQPGLPANTKEIAALRARIDSAERDLKRARAKFAAALRALESLRADKALEQVFGRRLLLPFAQVWPWCVRVLGRSKTTCTGQLEQYKRKLMALRRENLAARAKVKAAAEQAERSGRQLSALQIRHRDLLKTPR